jgi:preprotein translocase SecE subunit
VDAVQPAGGNAMTRWTAGAVAFLKDAYAELGKIAWPSRPMLKQATIQILVLATMLGLAIGWLDLLLQLVLVDGVARLTR